MDNLTEEQIQLVIDWMNKWEQLEGTAIPIRFKEDFSNTNELDVRTKQISKDVNDHLKVIATQKHRDFMTTAVHQVVDDLNSKREKQIVDVCKNHGLDISTPEKLKQEAHRFNLYNNMDTKRCELKLDGKLIARWSTEITTQFSSASIIATMG